MSVVPPTFNRHFAGSASVSCNRRPLPAANMIALISLPKSTRLIKKRCSPSYPRPLLCQVRGDDPSIVAEKLRQRTTLLTRARSTPPFGHAILLGPTPLPSAGKPDTCTAVHQKPGEPWKSQSWFLPVHTCRSGAAEKALPCSRHASRTTSGSSASATDPSV